MKVFTSSIIALLFFISLNAQSLPIGGSEELHILVSVVRRSSDNNIYFKTIVEEWQKPIESYIQRNYLDFNLCVPKADSHMIYISDEELRYLKRRFSNHSVKGIDKLKPELKDKTTRDSRRFETVHISMPVIFRNGTMAIYYAAGTYSGEFNLLSKKDGKWQPLCSSLVWIE